MPRRRTLVLTPQARTELVQLRNTAPQPYLRLRATAILLIADGYSAHWVARHGLGRPIAPDQVYEWLNRYEQEGIAGLRIREGRGRKPAYFRAQQGGGTRAPAPSAGTQPA